MPERCYVSMGLLCEHGTARTLHNHDILHYSPHTTPCHICSVRYTQQCGIHACDTDLSRSIVPVHQATENQADVSARTDATKVTEVSCDTPCHDPTCIHLPSCFVSAARRCEFTSVFVMPTMSNLLNRILHTWYADGYFVRQAVFRVIPHMVLCRRSSRTRITKTQRFTHLIS